MSTIKNAYNAVEHLLVILHRIMLKVFGFCLTKSYSIKYSRLIMFIKWSLFIRRKKRENYSLIRYFEHNYIKPLMLYDHQQHHHYNWIKTWRNISVVLSQYTFVLSFSLFLCFVSILCLLLYYNYIFVYSCIRSGFILDLALLIMHVNYLTWIQFGLIFIYVYVICRNLL
jgi:hypothetical protein